MRAIGRILCAAALVSTLGAASASADNYPSKPIRMIVAYSAGGTGDVVYIIDTSNGKLGAMTYDDARHELQTMQPIDIARVFTGGAGVNPGPGGTTPTGGYRKTPVAPR